MLPVGQSNAKCFMDLCKWAESTSWPPGCFSGHFAFKQLSSFLWFPLTFYFSDFVGRPLISLLLHTDPIYRVIQRESHSAPHDALQFFGLCHHDSLLSHFVFHPKWNPGSNINDSKHRKGSLVALSHLSSYHFLSAFSFSFVLLFPCLLHPPFIIFLFFYYLLLSDLCPPCFVLCVCIVSTLLTNLCEPYFSMSAVELLYAYLQSWRHTVIQCKSLQTHTCLSCECWVSHIMIWLTGSIV